MVKKVKGKKTKTEAQKLKGKYGQRFSLKDYEYVKDVLLKEVDKVINKKELYRPLSKKERIDSLCLLLNSCKRSNERVRDKSNKTYYGKPHDWLVDHWAMALYIVKNKTHITDWFNLYIKYVECRIKSLRPTLERINSNDGYTKQNIKMLSFRDNTLNATGLDCIGLVSYEGILTIFESPSVNGMIEHINETYELKLARGKFKGESATKLEYENGRYSVTIVNQKLLNNMTETIDVKYDVVSVESDGLRSIKVPRIRGSESIFTACLNKRGTLEVCIAS